MLGPLSLQIIKIYNQMVIIVESSALGTPNSLENCDTERCGGFDSLTLRQRINYGSKSN